MKKRKRDRRRALLAKLSRHLEISLDILRPRRIRTQVRAVRRGAG